MKKMPYSKLSKSGKYYRDNPKAAAKKKKTDTKINKRPEQRKKRSELSTSRTKYKKKHGKNSLNGKDLAHTKKWLVAKSVKANRGSKSDARWDKNARWGKKRKR